MEKKREELFGQHYTKFAAGLAKAVNEELWEKITLIDAENMDTSEFFDIYEKYLGDKFEFSWD